MLNGSNCTLKIKVCAVTTVTMQVCDNALLNAFDMILEKFSFTLVLLSVISGADYSNLLPRVICSW